MESDRNGGTVNINGLSNVISIAAGSQYTYGLKEDGTVWYWGSNGFGKINGKSAEDKSAPQL